MGFRVVRYFRHEEQEYRAGASCDELPKGALRHLVASGHVAEVGARPTGPTWPRGLAAQAVAGLEGAGIEPRDIAEMADDELGAIGGVGKSSIEKLRAVFGGPPEDSEEADDGQAAEPEDGARSAPEDGE